MCCFRDTRRLPLETHHAIRRPALKLENHVAAPSLTSRLDSLIPIVWVPKLYLSLFCDAFELRHDR